MARWPRLRLTEPSEAIIGASATDAAGKIDGDTASSGGGGLQLITSTRGSFVSRKHPAHILSTEKKKMGMFLDWKFSCEYNRKVVFLCLDRKLWFGKYEQVFPREYIKTISVQMILAGTSFLPPPREKTSWCFSCSYINHRHKMKPHITLSIIVFPPRCNKRLLTRVSDLWPTHIIFFFFF